MSLKELIQMTEFYKDYTNEFRLFKWAYSEIKERQQRIKQLEQECDRLRKAIGKINSKVEALKINNTQIKKQKSKALEIVEDLYDRHCDSDVMRDYIKRLKKALEEK
jgi:archaellum component FlaC